MVVDNKVRKFVHDHIIPQFFRQAVANLAEIAKQNHDEEQADLFSGISETPDEQVDIAS